MPLLALAVLLGMLAFAPLIGQTDMPLGRLAWLVLIAIFAAYPLVLYNTNLQGGYFHGGLVLASFGIAHTFLRARLHRVVVATTVVLLAYYILAYAVSGGSGGIFIGSSNRISTLFLALTVFTFVLGRRRYDLLLATVVFLAALSAQGSAGILASALLLSSVFLRDLRDLVNTGGATRYAIIFVGLGAIAGIAFTGPSLFEGETQRSLDIERLIGADVRFQVIDWYATENLTGTNLFAGTPLAYSVPVQLETGGWIWLANLHNSYLDLHSKTGIFSLVILGALLYRLLQLLRRDPYVGALMLVLLIRAFSDTVFILQGRYNFAFYVFLLPLGLLLQASRDIGHEIPDQLHVASEDGSEGLVQVAPQLHQTSHTNTYRR